MIYFCDVERHVSMTHHLLVKLLKLLKASSSELLLFILRQCLEIRTPFFLALYQHIIKDHLCPKGFIIKWKHPQREGWELGCIWEGRKRWWRLAVPVHWRMVGKGQGCAGDVLAWERANCVGSSGGKNPPLPECALRGVTGCWRWRGVSAVHSVCAFPG